MIIYNGKKIVCRPAHQRTASDFDVHPKVTPHPHDGHGFGEDDLFGEVRATTATLNPGQPRLHDLQPLAHVTAEEERSQRAEGALQIESGGSGLWAEVRCVTHQSMEHGHNAL